MYIYLSILLYIGFYSSILETAIFGSNCGNERVALFWKIPETSRLSRIDQPLKSVNLHYHHRFTINHPGLYFCKENIPMDMRAIR